MIPSTFTLTGASTRITTAGVRALILTGEQHGFALSICKKCKGTGWGSGPRNACRKCLGKGVLDSPSATPVSVTVFLGRDNTWAEAITRALTEGPDDGPAEIRSNLAFYPTRALTEGEGE